VDVSGRERVGWYLSQWIVELDKKKERDWSERYFATRGNGRVYTNTLRQDARVMKEMLVHATHADKDSNAFYVKQADVYDGFRECLLPGRDRQLQYGIQWKNKSVCTHTTWLSVGCGTARDIEYVLEVIRETDVRLYLLDLSEAMLDIARMRVSELGISHKVVFVHGDINEVFKIPIDENDKGDKIPSQFDIVTCTFCMTMVPMWEKALNTMIRLTKTGGTISLLDFTLRKHHHNDWRERITAWWFGNNGVYFNHKHVDRIQECKDLERIWYNESRSRTPYTFLWPTRYVYIGIKIES